MTRRVRLGTPRKRKKMQKQRTVPRSKKSERVAHYRTGGMVYRMNSSWTGAACM